MSAKPLPCPFCGREPTIMERPDNPSGTEFVCAIACYCGGYVSTAHMMEKRSTAKQAKVDTLAAWNTRSATSEATRPSVLFRPKLIRGASQGWWAEYGHCGASGATPDEAMRAFDRKWMEKQEPKP